MLEIESCVLGIPEKKPDRINRDQLHELLDLVLDINDSGNCVSFSMCGLAPYIATTIGVQFGAYRADTPFDYYMALDDYEVDLIPETVEKLREIKNAPDVGASKAVHEGH